MRYRVMHWELRHIFLFWGLILWASCAGGERVILTPIVTKVCEALRNSINSSSAGRKARTFPMVLTHAGKPTRAGKSSTGVEWGKEGIEPGREEWFGPRRGWDQWGWWPPCPGPDLLTRIYADLDSLQAKSPIVRTILAYPQASGQMFSYLEEASSSQNSLKGCSVACTSTAALAQGNLIKLVWFLMLF